jgi:IS1 family transposase
MNKLPNEKRIQIVKSLVEGNSLRSISRMVGVSINTVTKLLEDVGAACLKYQDEYLVNLHLNKIQCDEIWSFVYAKEKNVPEDHQGEFGYGDVWTWTAIDAETKLVPCWMVGKRNADAALAFIQDLESRLANRVQLTTDGHKAYLEAIDLAFGGEVDYAMLIKLYGNPDGNSGERRYSSGDCVGTEKKAILGNPNASDVSTSYVERQNLTMRMSMRRFTRLTNGFSKKVENHVYALALHFMYYNFARAHKSLATPYFRSPAMAAGVSDHIWKVEEIIDLLDKQ